MFFSIPTIKAIIRRRLSLVAFAALYYLSFNSFGQTITTSNTSGGWSSPASWSTGTVPGSRTDVTVNNTISINQDITIATGNYVFNADATDATGGTAYTLTMTGGSIVVNAGATVTFEGSGAFDGADVTVKSGGTLIIGALTINSHTLLIIESGGTLIVNGNVTDSNNGTGTTSVGGYFQINGNYDATQGGIEVTGTGVFQTTGTIITSGGSTVFGSTNDCTTGPCSGSSLSCGSINQISPASQYVCTSQTAATISAVTNATSVTYQWQWSSSAGSGFTDISGATSATLDPANSGSATVNNRMSSGLDTYFRMKLIISGCSSTQPDYSPSSAILFNTSTPPSVTLSTTSLSACSGIASTVTIPYTVNSGSLSTYSLSWSPSTGNLPTATNLSTTGSGNSNISVNVPSTAVAGNYTGTLYFYDNNSCSPGSKTFTLNIGGSTPTLSGVSASAVCQTGIAQNSSVSFTTSNSPNLYSVSWNSTAIAAGFTNITNATLSSSPLSVAVPAGAVNGSTYTGTLSVSNGCATSVLRTFTVTVNSRPTMTSASTATICSGKTVSIPLTASISSNFSWLATNNANTSGESTTAQTSSTLSNTISNLTTSVQAVSYTVTPTSTANGCVGSSQAVTVTVNPKPTMTSTNTAAICSGSTVVIPLAADLSSNFTWLAANNANTTGESTVAQHTGTLQNTITTTSTSAQSVIYTVTPTSVANACVGSAQTVTVTVNPKPTMSSASTNTICSGATVSIPLTATVPSSFTWSAGDNVNTTGESTTTQTSTTLSNTITDNTTSTQTVMYIVTPTSTAGSCVGTSQVVTVTVNPKPTMTSAAAATICSAANVTIPLTATLSSSFTWVATDNINTSGESLTTQITSTLNNTITSSSSAAQNIVYTVTPTALVSGNCVGTSQTVTVTVNPKPSMTSANSTSICSSGAVNIPLTANVSSNFVWSAIDNANITGESTSNQTSSTLNNTLTSSSLLAQSVVYSVVPTTISGNCTGNSQTVTVTVNPRPSMTSSSTATICSDGTVVIPLTANIGSSFNWVAADNANTSGESIAIQSSGVLNNTINNSTATPQDVNYTVTPTSIGGGCTGTGQTVTVTVNPTPSMTSAGNSAVCSGATFAIPLTSNVPSAFTWIATNNTAVSGESLSLQATNTLSNTLTIASSSPQSVTYTVIPTSTAGSCTGLVQIITVTVNPLPAMTSSNASSICSEGTTGISLSTDLPSSFTWVASNNDNTTGESLTAQTTGAITNTIVSSSSVPESVLYTVIPTTISASCVGLPQTITVVVNPKPVVTSVNTTSICSGGTLSIPLTSNIGSTFIWSASDNVNTTGESMTDQTSATINNTITSTVNNPEDVSYSIQPTSVAGGCIGNTQILTVTVNPTPVLSTPVNPAAICSGNVFDYLPQSPTTGAAFTWHRAANTGIFEASASGAGTISETLTNITTGAVDVDYTLSIAAAACSTDIHVTVSVLTPHVQSWNGNTSGDWSSTSNWSCKVIPTTADNITIPANAVNFPLVSTDAIVKNITIANGASLTLLDNAILTVLGDFNNSGAFSANKGIVNFSGASDQAINGNGAKFHTIRVNKTAGAVTITQALPLVHLLDIQSATTVNSNGFLTLQSKDNLTDNDASIGTLPTGASVAGNVIVNRFIKAGGNINRYMSSPLQGVTVSQLSDDLTVKTGSVRLYNEPTAGVIGNGYQNVSTSNTMSVGRGYLVYMYDNIDLTWDLTGKINAGTITLPVTYTTTTGGVDADGWNLVGNPYPSAIQLHNSAGWELNKIDPTISVPDLSVGSGYPNYYHYYSFNTADNTGDLPAGEIAMGQAFWVHANGTGASLKINEAAKTSAAGGKFYRSAMQSSPSEVLKLTINKGDFYDNAFFKINPDASADFDIFDGYKKKNPHMNIYLVDQQNRELVMHTLSEIQDNEKIFLGIEVTEEGLYSLSVSNTENFSLSDELVLVDAVEGQMIPVNEVNKYYFSITDTSKPLSTRFYLTRNNFEKQNLDKLIVSYPNPVTEFLTMRSLVPSAATAELFDANGVRVLSQSWSGESQIDMRELRSGIYILKIRSSEGCVIRKIVKQ